METITEFPTYREWLADLTLSKNEKSQQLTSQQYLAAYIQEKENFEEIKRTQEKQNVH